MEEREPLRRLLAEAASPGLAPGAAERIAGGAWERAESLRATAHAGRVIRFRRRVLQVGAAAAVAASAVIAVRGTAPAFAVEGDSVQVRRGDDWATARRVPVGSWVFVPLGAQTTVRSDDGSFVAPRPGALFRIVAAAPRPAWRVELRSGDAEVSGATMSLRVSDALEVARAGGQDSLRVVASLGAALAAAPIRIEEARAAVDAAPWVRSLQGVARVADLRGTDVLLLRPTETAVRLTLGADGRLVSRLARETPWSPDVAPQVFLGDRVVGAYPRAAGGFSIALRSRDDAVRTVSVARELRDEALDQLALVAAERAAASYFVMTPAEPAPPSAALLAAAGLPTAEYQHDAAGRLTRIVVRGDGSAALERTGEPPREFASVAALRAGAPEAAALFGDRLR